MRPSGRLARQCDFCELVFVGVADYYAYARERGDFFWGALGVASRYYDLGFGILAADAADGGAGVLIGGRSDGASVQDYDCGLRGRACAGEAALFELAFEGGAVGLSGTAAEVLYVVGGHMVMLAHRGMVREILRDKVASLQ